MTQRVKFTVTSHSADDSGAEDGEAGDATRADGATPELSVAESNEDEPSSNVVDLTDYSQIAEPSDKAVTVAVDAKVKTNETKISNSNPSEALVVKGTKEEEAATKASAVSPTNLDVPINPWEPFTKYKFPPINLLKKYDTKPVIDMEEIKANNNHIVEVIALVSISARSTPLLDFTVTLYEITPAEGVRISRIRGLEADIAMSLAALGIRIIAPIPGKGTIGIEVPNKNPQIVSMESVLNTKKFQNSKMALPMALGKTITNEVFMVDLAKVCPTCWLPVPLVKANL